MLKTSSLCIEEIKFLKNIWKYLKKVYIENNSKWIQYLWIKKNSKSSDTYRLLLNLSDKQI